MSGVEGGEEGDEVESDQLAVGDDVPCADGVGLREEHCVNAGNDAGLSVE